MEGGHVNRGERKKTSSRARFCIVVSRRRILDNVAGAENISVRSSCSDWSAKLHTAPLTQKFRL